MFCPSCGTRNPEGVRFCKTCGTDLSGRGAGAPAPQAIAQAPVPGAPAFARPTTAAHRHIGRGGVIAGIAAAVTVALVVAVGLRTNWFGLARPHLVPGTYTITSSLVDSSLASHATTMVLSVAEGDSVTFTFEGGQSFGETHGSAGPGGTTFMCKCRSRVRRWVLERTASPNSAM